MNRTTKLILVLAATSFATLGSTQAQLISGWTFETTVPITAGPHTAEAGSAPGQALGVHAGASTYSNPQGNGSTESFSSNSWAVGDYYQFSLSTVGQSNIFMTFSAQGSNTGPRDFSLQYSTTGVGGTFTSFGNYALQNLNWSNGSYSSASVFTFDLSSVSGLNNNANVVFRLVDTSTVNITGAAVAAAGSSRVDDVNISANAAVYDPRFVAVPEPATYMLFGIGLLACAQRFRRNKKA